MLNAFGIFNLTRCTYSSITFDHFWIPDFNKAFLALFYNNQTSTRFFYKQHFYKQRQDEIGKKSSKC